MNIKKYCGILTLMFLIILLGGMSVHAQAMPVTVDSLEVDDVQLNTGAANLFNLERGEEVEVDIVFTPTEDLEDSEVEIKISGYEYNDVNPIYAQTQTEDYSAGVTYKRTLKLRLSEEVEEDRYKLRLTLSDRDHDPLVQTYDLKLDVPRHRARIDDVILFPNDNVQAGRALLATVRVDNKGEKEERDVRVMISIPELGVSGVDYIDEIDPEDEEETEEIFLRIPESAKSGRYDVEVQVDYDNGYSHETTTRSVNVVGNPNYAAPTDGVRTVVTVGSQLETLGETGALYPITVTNNELTSKTFTLSVEGTGDFANVKVNPTSTMIVESKESQLFSIYLTPKDGVEAGTRVFSAKLSSNGKTLKEIQLTANVEEQNNGFAAFKDILEVLLVILVVMLVIVGLVIGFRKLSSDEDSESPQTYY